MPNNTLLEKVSFTREMFSELLCALTFFFSAAHYS